MYINENSSLYIRRQRKHYTSVHNSLLLRPSAEKVTHHTRAA